MQQNAASIQGPLYVSQPASMAWMCIRLLIRRLWVRPPPGWQYSFVEIDHEIHSIPPPHTHTHTPPTLLLNAVIRRNVNLTFRSYNISTSSRTWRSCSSCSSRICCKASCSLISYSSRTPASYSSSEVVVRVLVSFSSYKKGK